LDWNVLLDNKGGPDHGDPTGEECEGLIQCGSHAMLIADLTVSPPVVYKQAFYWYMGHVSRFVPPGSVRLGASLARVSGGNATSPLLGVPFETPEGGTALVLQNAQDSSEWVAVDDARAGHLGYFELPPHSIVTLTW
jgi:glucosylceramidase